MIAASSVTNSPTSSGTTIERVLITLPVFGRSMPAALNSEFSPLATPIPATMPSAGADQRR